MESKLESLLELAGDYARMVLIEPKDPSMVADLVPPQ
jgi:hypothetical protein